MKNYLKYLTWSIEIPLTESHLPLTQTTLHHEENDPFFGIKKKTAYPTDLRNPKAVLKFESSNENFMLEIDKNDVLKVFQEVEKI